MLNIEMGNPVILVKADNMAQFMLFDGCKGMANAVTIVGEVTYICFHPNGMGKFFWMLGERFILDEAKMKEMEEELHGQ